MRATRVIKTDFELEMQFAYDGADRRLKKFPLHVRCFAAWELERAANEGPDTA